MADPHSPETLPARLCRVDDLVRRHVRAHGTTRPAMLLLVDAFQRQAIEPAPLQLVTDVPLGGRELALLVSYHGRRGAVDLAGRSSGDSHRYLRAAGVAVAVQLRPDEVTDAEAADKVVDRFLRDLDAAPDGTTGPASLAAR